MVNSKTLLEVGFLQCSIEWENTRGNLERYTRLIAKKERGLDLFVLPEMFHSGFTMDPCAVAQPMDGEVVQWMQQTACEHDMAVAGSVVIEENGKFFNRFLFVYPNGQIAQYNKRHLFRMAGEHEVYTGGTDQIIVEHKGWRIRTLVCYDLRFPVWSRNRSDTDLMIYVANWPTPRQEAWDVLLRARAIENQCYVLGVNRIGSDSSVGYSGGSAMVDYKGSVMSGGKGVEDTIYYVSIDKESLDGFRDKFPAYLDGDSFVIS